MRLEHLIHRYYEIPQNSFHSFLGISQRSPFPRWGRLIKKVESLNKDSFLWVKGS